MSISEEAPVMPEIPWTDEPRELAVDINLQKHGSIYVLYHSTLHVFGMVIKSQNHHATLDQEDMTLLKESLSLLYLWAHGLDLDHLEHSVSKRSGLQVFIIRALLRIKTTLTSDPLAVVDDQPQLQATADPSLELQEDVKDNDTCHEDLAHIEDDDGVESGLSSISDGEDSDESKDSTVETALSVSHSIPKLKDDVVNLMNLLPTLKHVSKRDQSRKVETTSHTVAPRVKPEAQVYANRILDTYKGIDSALADRLGEANWLRFQRLFGRRDIEREALLEDDEGNDEKSLLEYLPISTFHDSGLGTLSTVKSRYAASLASNTSFLSTQSAQERDARRVPPAPKEVALGAKFTCPICKSLVHDVNSRIKWKMHFFADLQAYICTFNSCSDSRLIFPSRKSWAEHEFREHRINHIFKCHTCQMTFVDEKEFIAHFDNAHQHSPLSCDHEAICSNAKVAVERDIGEERCPFCFRSNWNSRRTFISHVGQHMEETALQAVPRSFFPDTDEDAENDSSSDDIRSMGHNKAGEPPKQPLAKRSNIMSILNDEPSEANDKEGGLDEHGVRMDLIPRQAVIIPNLEGFRSHIVELNPRIAEFLRDRIAYDQLRRYNRLQQNKAQHVYFVQKSSCPSGDRCHEFGFGPQVIDTPRPSKDVNASTDLSDQVFPPGVPGPPVARFPSEFECPFCFKVKMFQKPTDWIKHIHEDVQPFTCTFSYCSEQKSFKRKADWVRHENERHRHLEWWQCNEEDCNHICFRKDKFLQHLVHEHRKPEPRPEIHGTIEKTTADATEQVDDIWRLVDICHRETIKDPRDEPCKFCRNICRSWKALSTHLARHMEQIALPLLKLVDQVELSPSSPILVD